MGKTSLGRNGYAAEDAGDLYGITDLEPILWLVTPGSSIVAVPNICILNNERIK